MTMFITHYNFKVVRELHEGPIKGHFGINTTNKKILTSSYRWPTLNKDVAKMCQTCDICQRLGPLWWSGGRLLKQILTFEPLMKWASLILWTQSNQQQDILVINILL
jgi:hypothetical protein